ncbi:hypothetical protein [Desulforhopalus sp. IMCC35007]|uniref:hypothetical protein n=1 Tax=Desulforhopalus sp. IMCC35007 TaxID=2569543 RepID=UPI0010AE0545|nr:hypothetical protein [Desulforhopalus sp. IMCC35007]TKB11225.1 hypothetical protein FCL48_04235 [Desulforhopalus sp. IMCC35007]
MRSFFILFLMLPFITDCSSRIPEAITYPYSQQKKMQASEHWELLAQDLANRINNELILKDKIDTSVYVKTTCGDEKTPCEANETSTFNEAFRDLLITGLYGYGIPTLREKQEEAIEVLYKVQVVRHNANRVRSLQPGLLTALSSAIVVLRNAPSELIVLAVGAGADVANTSFTSNGHYEVIITTSMVEKGQYLFRASDIYYINDKDFYQYQETHAQTTSIPMKTRNVQQKITFPSVAVPSSEAVTPLIPDPVDQPSKTKEEEL